MPRIKIRQMGTKVATKGVHFNGDRARRKLEVGEVVEIPTDEALSDGRKLIDVLNATGVIEVTLDPVTRPLGYLNVREAKVCSPSFKSRGRDEDLERDKALAAVAERMANDSDVPEQSGSPAEDDNAAPSLVATQKVAPAPVRKQKPAAANRRALRRAAAVAGTSGQENTA